MNHSGIDQLKTSNNDINWSKLYDFYEVEMREKYKTVSKYQNDSHFEMIRSKASSYLNKNNIFCEIGFGAGLTLRHALPYFGKVVGLDISPRNVELAKRELEKEGYSNFELYTYNIMKFDSRFCNKFDVISFIHGLEHFSQDDYPVILNNIKKYLKPRGIFTGALPYKNQFNYRMCPHCNTLFEIDGHISSHDKHSLSKLFEGNDFKILYLDNYNLSYALKTGTLFKRIIRFLMILFKIKRTGQLEYIVTPQTKN